MTKSPATSFPRLVLLAILLATSLPAGPAGAAAEPKRLSAAEKAAVTWALDYLRSGPAAFVSQLADGTPWRQDPAAATEIELRAGPPAGAVWRLGTAAAADSAVFHLVFPSGAEEVLRLQVVEQAGLPRLAALTAGWDVAAAPARPAEAPAADPGPAAPAEKPAYSPVIPFAIGLSGLLAIWLAILKPARRLIFAGLAVLLLTLAGWLLFRPLDGPPRAADAVADATSPAPKTGAPRGNERLEWRRSLAAGHAALDKMPGGSGLIPLWAAEEAILANRLDWAEQGLAAAGPFAESPAAQRLRAKLAGRRGDATGVVAAELELIRRWPHDEVFVAEGAEAAYQLGFEKQAKELTERLRDFDSRWPAALRLLALSDAMEGLPSVAGETLEIALQSEPHRRAELLAGPLEAYLIEAAPAIEATLRLGQPMAPLYDCPGEGSDALPDKPGALPTRIGRSLYYEVGDARLEIPGGCRLAPAGAPALSGEAWLDRRDGALRAGAASLGRELAENGGRLAPRERRQLGETLASLFAGQHFDEIVALTEKLDPAAQAALSEESRRARVQALHRLGRRKEAFDLLVQWVGADFDQRRSDPGVLFDFAELMALEHQYELASRLLAAADRRLPVPITQERRVQLDIEKKLIEHSLHLERPPFKLYFSAEMDPLYAQRVAAYLEQERKRLAAFVPPPPAPREIEVLLLDPRDFRQSYGGGGVEIVGLYDGRIRVPLGRLKTLDEYSRAILTHELVHALVADASADRAPHWLQEGLAQLVEPGRRDANPIKAMKERNQWLAFPLLEGALSGMATPRLAQQGYDESLWAVVYLQQSRGRQIFGKLFQAYRREASAEEVFRSELGLSPAQFDDKLVAWGGSGAVPIWENPASQP